MSRNYIRAIKGWKLLTIGYPLGNSSYQTTKVANSLIRSILHDVFSGFIYQGTNFVGLLGGKSVTLREH